MAIDGISTGDAELAAFVLEKAVRPNADADFCASMGWPPEFVSLHVTVNDCTLVENALVAFIEANLTEKVISNAVGALGKAFNPDHRHLLNSILRIHLVGDPNTLFQAMIALNNIGVDFGGARSFSIRESAKNQETSRRYLDSLDS